MRYIRPRVHRQGSKSMHVCVKSWTCCDLWLHRLDQFASGYYIEAVNCRPWATFTPVPSGSRESIFFLMSMTSQLWAEPIEAVVFDMDGTLIDSEAVFRTALFNTCTELGFEMTPDVHLSILGGTAENTRRVLADAFGAAFPFSHFYERCTLNIQAELGRNPMRAKRGAQDLLRFLDQSGIAMAVASSSRLIHASNHLDKVGLLPFFRTVVTRDDVANPKPHPEPYLTAAGRLGVDPARCVAVEDSPTGVRAATAAGMRTILVPDMQKPSSEIAALCALVLEDLAQAHEHLTGIFAEPV